MARLQWIYCFAVLFALSGCASNPMTYAFTKTELPSAAQPAEVSRKFQGDFDSVWNSLQLTVARQGGMVLATDKNLGLLTYSFATLAKLYITVYVERSSTDSQTTVFFRAWCNGVPIYGDMERPFFDALDVTIGRSKRSS